ncbi:phenylalanine--tRNA ligase subunit beta [Acidocella aromatica]|uniref:Phenylalanine--tRNA ligase beta subunit n=1 Tax=Acidocella aromatica TaxID=1303579 RepID=A0A840VAA3_9PROT|nr:phenylalanine--tRNA ligase subunit beta [Acidocella aromatica]MBB5372646.1 phenylalanyl-tRNA synthetase beta chain [Acidocella aromatica]
MKFSLSWLKTWLDTDASLDEITTTLSAIGLEVEGVENKAETLKPFVIAQIVEATRHPNADKLQVCRVNTGAGEVTIVCGAPNARTGLKVVMAPPGAYVPGAGITIKIGEIRGQKSEGMLTSFRELGLEGDADGIIELPEDARVGETYAKWVGLDEPIIEIAITPNRGDCLAVRGIARDLAAAGLGKLKPFTAPAIAASGASAVTWKNEFPEAAPWVLGRTVRGVKNGQSPDWLKQRLESIGLRPINTLVDITNFFTFDLGRPLHVFDVAKLSGNALTLRRGQEGDAFLGLHGKEIKPGAEDCVIADAAGAQSLAGITGGETTGCDESTTEVFIECALFDRVRIAQTGQRTGIFSDARQRFERGIDSQLLPEALDAATDLVLKLCGGEASEITEAGSRPEWTREAKLRFERIRSFGGSDISPAEAVASLERLGFAVRAEDETSVTVAVPSWRNDVAQPQSLDQAPDLPGAQAAAEGAAEIEPEVDLIEEVLRLKGLDAIAPVSLRTESVIPAPILTAKQTRTALARRALAVRGLLECVTFSFADDATCALFGETPEGLRLANPIAADLNQMRPTPLVTLSQAAARNVARGFGEFGLFEIGPAYAEDRSQTLVAAGLRVGETPLSALAPSRRYDALDAKADALAVLSALGVPMDAVTTSVGSAGFYHPGQSGELRQGPKTLLARFGALHPSLCAKLDLPVGSVAFEIFLDAIPEPKRRKKTAPALPPFQPLRRDFAFLVPETTPAETVLRAAKGAERNLIANAVLFDRYQGKGVPEGQVSLAIAVTLQPSEKSLTDAEIETVCAKIVAEVGKKAGATLRG